MQKFYRTMSWSLFLIKLESWGPANLLKNTPTQVFPCEICKFLKNNYYEQHLWTSASIPYLKRDLNTSVFGEFCELFKNAYNLGDLLKASSETLVQGSIFKKVASLTAWRLLTLLERDHRTGISLWILRNF